jgi:hypothetical protein
MLKFLMSLVLSLAHVFILAFAIKTCWAWFIMPLFNLPAVGLLQAYGLAIFAGLFSLGHVRVKSKKELDEVKATNSNDLHNWNILAGIIYTLLVFVSAFVVHHFMVK